MNRGQELAALKTNTLAQIITSPTRTLTVTKHEIRSRKGMTTLAIDLTSLLSRKCIAAQNVFAVRNRLKVIGVDASPNSAQMIDCETIGDWADQKLINEPMSTTHPARVIQTELPVTTAIKTSRPQPAPIELRRNLGQKSYSNLIIHEYSVAQ